ncbi:MAG: OmpA family protein [Parachlamydiaceae bacterium]
MKALKLLPFKALKVCVLLFVMASCSRPPEEIWDDTKSCGRHITRGIKALAGRQVSSRQVQSKDDFVYWEEPVLCENSFGEGEFVMIPNEHAKNEMIPSQPRETPGEANSSIPGIDAFRDPTTVSGLKGIFRNVHFAYNSNLIKGQDNLNIIQSVSEYMKSHPGVYIFVEGHCDERGPEAYNLALGARRSNAVRNILIEEGVNPDHIFTISYGAERPLVFEQTEEGWAKNRRVEFKIYQR